MATLDPTIAVITCEGALRQLMEHAYSAEYGPAWLVTVSSSEQRSAWQHRYQQEQLKRTPKGVALVPNAGLAYSDMQDLIGIASRHWAPLAPALCNKRETIALLVRFETLRNTAQHSRGLVAFEEELLSGIAGQIRNQVAKFMSTQDDSGDYFPFTESITDSFGHKFEGTPSHADGAGHVDCTDTPVHPGQTVSFTCIGIDPQGRELDWDISTMAAVGQDRQRSTDGQEAVLSWPVLPTDMNPRQMVFVTMRAEGAEFHRFGQHDQQVAFLYQVRPPSIK